jgi:hypothetical protein
MEDEINAGANSQEIDAMKRPARTRRSHTSPSARGKKRSTDGGAVDVPEQFSSELLGGELSYSFRDDVSAPHEE